MPKYISPLDDIYIRFDAAAGLLAKHYSQSTPHSMLEMLILAMWAGRFNPPELTDDDQVDLAQRNDPEKWLAVPIQKPKSQLKQSQLKLKPLPYEYYEAGRETILSVMYCDGLLPGDPDGWDELLKRENNLLYLHGKDEAFEALIRMPLHCYCAAGQDYLRSLHIPRLMLQNWLDRRSSSFNGLIISGSTPIREASPANDTRAQLKACRRGRPSLPAWESIEAWAVKLNAENPDMQRKQLAGLLYTRALEQFDESAVPNETTIFRRLSKYLTDPRPPKGNAA